MTLKDIARLAGVSPSTVSRVLNQPESSAASAETRARIWEIVRKSGYTPNPNARALRMGADAPKNRSLCCIYARSDEMLNDPFFSRIARAMEQEAFGRGYIVRYSLSAKRLDSEALDTVSAYPVDGAVVLGRLTLPLLRFLKNHYRQVVVTGLNPIDADYDQIICSGYQAANTAMEHLFSLGHQRIAYLGEVDRETRWQGYWDALSRRRLPVERAYILETALSADGGYQAGLRLAEMIGEVTAAFCANDQTAIGALKALAERGVQVPEQLSVISIDDIEMARYVTPMLTTVHIPAEEMGRQTARMLIERIEGVRRLPVKVEVPFRLVKRESCAGIRPQKNSPARKE